MTSSESEISAAQVQLLQEAFAFGRAHSRRTDGHFIGDIKVKVIDVKYNEENHPVVTFEVQTEEFMSNDYGIVHGGYIATMMDFLTTYGGLGDLKYWNESRTEIDMQKAIKDFGVSRYLSCQYLKAVPLNTPILLEATMVSNTKRNSYSTARIMSRDKKVLYVTGTHDKVKLYGKL